MNPFITAAIFNWIASDEESDSRDDTPHCSRIPGPCG